MADAQQTTSWGMVLALWAAGLGAAAQYGKMSVIYDLLPAHYPQAGASLGLVVSIVGFIGIFLGVAAGLLVARIRFRRALLWALWMGAAMSAFQALLPPLPWMLTSRLIEGLSHLGMVVAIPTLIAQICAPRDRGLALTLWGTFFGVAFAVLAFLGLPLVQKHGVSALLLLHGAYLAACALFLSARLKRLNIAPPTTAFSLRQLARDHLTIYRSPAIAAPAVGWIFYTFCFVSILTVLPAYLDTDERGWVMGAMPLVSIASSMTLGVWLLRVTSAVSVVVLGFGLSTVSVIWMGITLDAAACLAVAAAMGLIQGASFAAVPQLNPTAAAQAQANGGLAQAGNLGNTLGTPVMALATSGFGFAGLPILAACAFAAGAAAHLILAWRRKAT